MCANWISLQFESTVLLCVRVCVYARDAIDNVCNTSIFWVLHVCLFICCIFLLHSCVLSCLVLSMRTQNTKKEKLQSFTQLHAHLSISLGRLLLLSLKAYVNRYHLRYHCGSDNTKCRVHLNIYIRIICIILLLFVLLFYSFRKQYTNLEWERNVCILLMRLFSMASKQSEQTTFSHSSIAVDRSAIWFACNLTLCIREYGKTPPIHTCMHVAAMNRYTGFLFCNPSLLIIYLCKLIHSTHIHTRTHLHKSMYTRMHALTSHYVRFIVQSVSNAYTH